MWEKTKPLNALFICVLFCLSFLAVGTSSAAAAETAAETVTISKEDWITLQKNNAAQKRALEESQRELGEARKALTESEQALIEAENLLKVSQMTSTEAQERLMQLLSEYGMQKAEIETLRKELEAQMKESLTASEALKAANQFLQDTKKEIEARESAWRKRENQLERQRLEWQIASVLFGYIGYEIGRH